MPTALEYFVSYAHQDRPVVDALLGLLRPRLKNAVGPGFAEWNDRMIPLGAAWRAEIDDALARCAFGLFLLSPEFFASDFIARHEIPRFIQPLGPETVAIHKPLVPVGLTRVPLDGSVDLKGIQHVQIFRDDRERWFSETRGHIRGAFADQLVAAIRAKLGRIQAHLPQRDPPDLLASRDSHRVDDRDDDRDVSQLVKGQGIQGLISRGAKRQTFVLACNSDGLEHCKQDAMESRSRANWLTVTAELRPPAPRLWSPLGNPYEPGISVFGPERFFGRASDVLDILTSLTHRSTYPTLVRGPRRIGKTSLLKQIAWLLRNPDELHAHPLSPNQVVELRTIQPVLIDLRSLSARGITTSAGLFGWLLDEVYQAFGHAVPISWPKDTRDPVYAFQRRASMLLGATGSRLLIMVDEWDEVYSPGLEAVGCCLRSVILGNDSISWIISGTWISRIDGRQAGSPLSSMCRICEITDLSPESAALIATRPAERVGLHWDSDAVPAAVEQTGQWPFLIQILGSSLVDLLNTERRPPGGRFLDCSPGH